MKVVKVLEAIQVVSAIPGHEPRRVVILQRDDGHFSFAEEYFYTSEYEGEIIAQGWARLGPEGILATAEVAEAEGRSRLQQRYKAT